MHITIDVFHHGLSGDRATSAKFDEILALLQSGDARMSQQLDDLKAEVTRATTVSQSAVTLIGGLAAKIEELKDDPVALQALADEMRANNDALGTAVTQNTPSA